MHAFMTLLGKVMQAVRDFMHLVRDFMRQMMRRYNIPINQGARATIKV